MQQQVQAPVQRVSLLVLMRMFVLIRALCTKRNDKRKENENENQNQNLECENNPNDGGYQEDVHLREEEHPDDSVEEKQPEYPREGEEEDEPPLSPLADSSVDDEEKGGGSPGRERHRASRYMQPEMPRQEEMQLTRAAEQQQAQANQQPEQQQAPVIQQPEQQQAQANQQPEQQQALVNQQPEQQQARANQQLATADTTTLGREPTHEARRSISLKNRRRPLGS